MKLGSKAEIIIANGAECEPLLHKDAAVMEHYAAEVVRGVELCMAATGAQEGAIGIKAKKQKAVEAVEEACRGTRVRVQLLGDFYPAGDEYDLVYTVTGKLIPPGGLPVHVGAIVSNVETLVNIAQAVDGRPVTHKTITIAGAVAEPVSLTVPIGISFRECIAAAGGATCDDPVLAIGGLMMGENTDDLDRPVVKTSTGAIILPRTHHVMEKKFKPAKVQAAIGKSACDQCRYCTEFCPRFLLGYQVEPHQVMRTLAFTETGAERFNEWAALCCSCGLCTLYACPEELYPKEACDDSKAVLRKQNFKWTGKTDIKVHPMRDGRHVPIKSLMKKMHVEQYDSPAPLRAGIVEPSGARGIFESFNVATLIKAADAAAKAADVQLLEVRLAMALGGKAFCTLTGDVSSVQTAVAAGRAVIAEAGVLVNAVVISRPHPDVYREVI